eukprot:g5340.t1
MVKWMSRFQCDTGALVVGRFFGKTRAVELISPNKTWEGFLGGISLSLLSVVFLLAMRPVFPIIPALDTSQCVIVTFLVVFGSVIGDLLESLLKRAAGLKDSGKLFPGHGGALDRADALLLTFPLLYFYTSHG